MNTIFTASQNFLKRCLTNFSITEKDNQTSSTLSDSAGVKSFPSSKKKVRFRSDAKWKISSSKLRRFAQSDGNLNVYKTTNENINVSKKCDSDGSVQASHIQLSMSPNVRRRINKPSVPSRNNKKKAKIQEGMDDLESREPPKRSFKLSPRANEFSPSFENIFCRTFWDNSTDPKRVNSTSFKSGNYPEYITQIPSSKEGNGESSESLSSTNEMSPVLSKFETKCPLALDLLLKRPNEVQVHPLILFRVPTVEEPQGPQKDASEHLELQDYGAVKSWSVHLGSNQNFIKSYIHNHEMYPQWLESNNNANDTESTGVYNWAVPCNNANWIKNQLYPTHSIADD